MIPGTGIFLLQMNTFKEFRGKKIQKLVSNMQCYYWHFFSKNFFFIFFK